MSKQTLISKTKQQKTTAYSLTKENTNI